MRQDGGEQADLNNYHLKISKKNVHASHQWGKYRHR